ncbi:MAG: cytochrome c biogenesis protein, partial [Planctomycetota bacterium]
VQEQIVRLGSSLRSFEALTHFLDFTRVQIPTGPSETLKKLFPHRDAVGGGSLLAVVPQMINSAERLRAEKNEAELKALREAIIPMERGLLNAGLIALVPPPKPKDAEAEWWTPDDVAANAFESPAIMQRPLAAISALQSMVDARAAGNEQRLLAASAALHKEVTSLAQARNEYGTVKLEVTYYKLDLMFWAQILFVLGFVIASMSWLIPQSRKLPLVASFPTGLGLILLTGAITLRCIIRSRPPVSTLYETIIFITAVCVLLGLITEWITRQRVALGLSALLGAMGMFLAAKYEISGRQDTMPSLVAVLDTNFWLSTHVTTITIGYAAGLLASAVAHVYLLGRLFGIKRQTPAFYRTVGRMVYGLICFSLLFSVVGTILGGIWANDSWGRFWGWDPKENGALMICLWQLAMLHGRMGGFLKSFGFSCAAVFGGAVVATSWWGVNLLQIGLHSYGFTSGAFVALMAFFGVEGLLLLVMGVYWLVTKNQGTGSGPISGEPVPLG